MPALYCRPHPTALSSRYTHPNVIYIYIGKYKYTIHTKMRWRIYVHIYIYSITYTIYSCMHVDVYSIYNSNRKYIYRQLMRKTYTHSALKTIIGSNRSLYWIRWSFGDVPKKYSGRPSASRHNDDFLEINRLLSPFFLLLRSLSLFIFIAWVCAHVCM